MGRSIEKIDPRLLELDFQHPRFGLTDKKDEQAALHLLATRGNLGELWDSINQRGFERFEPLVAYRCDDGRFIVVDGNRRLAAVKTMIDRSLLDGIEMSPPPCSAEAVATTNTLSVFVVACREDADDYIGAGHTNGPISRVAPAQARFGEKRIRNIKVEPDQTDTHLQSHGKRRGDHREPILRSSEVAYKILEEATAQGTDRRKLAEIVASIRATGTLAAKGESAHAANSVDLGPDDRLASAIQFTTTSKAASKFTSDLPAIWADAMSRMLRRD